MSGLEPAGIATAPAVLGVGPNTVATDGVNGVSDARALDTLSSTIAESSGKVPSGRQSSKPSRHTSDSRFTEPDAAFERSSLKRIGPTGTPLMPTSHSSAGMLNGSWTAASVGLPTASEKAPASAPT